MSVTDGVRLREIGGRRSSQETGKSAFAAAARAADPALAEEIAAEKSWRKHYLAPLRRLVEVGARSGRTAVEIAGAGLTALHERVEIAGGADAMPLTEAVRATDDPAFRTEVVKGEGSGRPELTIPYRGEALRGDGIRRQLDRWVDANVIEPSCREAVEKVLANPDWLDLSDRRFVILGAGSEMGALEALSAWGAEIVAVDLPEPRLWERTIRLARDGRGKLSVPVRGDRGGEMVTTAGTDLLRDTPEIAAWVRMFDAPFTVVDDTYADGSKFMLLAASADALMSHLAEQPGVSLAYLATPTDVFAVPEDVVNATRAGRRRGRGMVMRAVSGRSLYRPSYEELIEGEDGRRWGIVDCLVAQQGANYALAKTLQRWRAVSARAQGTLVSSNVAPATRTKSVTRNRALAAAYRGASAYGVEIFEPETSRWLMAALLVHDLRNDGGGAPRGGHPFDLFAGGAAHGGIWRLGYEPRSILPLAVLRGLTRRS